RRDRRQTGAPRLAVDEDGAGAAAALLASRLRARDVELVAQDVQERRERRARYLRLDAVHDQLHPFSSWSRARRTSRGRIRRRYAAEATASSTGSTSFNTSSARRDCSTERQRTAVGPTPATATRSSPFTSTAAAFATAYE